MAIVFDAATVGADGSLTHPVTDIGSNRIVFGLCYGQSDPGAMSATFGGQVMTLITELSSIFGVFYLANPPTGSQSFVVTNPGARSLLGCVSLSGVDPNTPYGTPVTDTSGDNHIDLAGEEGWMMLDFIGASRGSGGVTYTVDASQTQRFNQGYSGFGASSCAGVSCGTIACSTEGGAFSVAMDWTRGGSGASAFGHVGLPLRPASGGRQRVTRYLTNTYMSRQAGSPVILDVLGRRVPPEQIEPDQFIFTGGPFMPSPRFYANNIANPAVQYIESVTAREGRGASIDTVKESLFTSLFRRLGAAG